MLKFMYNFDHQLHPFGVPRTRITKCRMFFLLLKGQMVQHLSLEAVLPILKSRRKTIVLLSCQLSLMEIVTNPTPDRIVRACKSLYAKSNRQANFNIDYWGEKVFKRSKNEILQMQQFDLDRGMYPDSILAGIMASQQKIKDMNGSHVDFFDIR